MKYAISRPSFGTGLTASGIGDLAVSGETESHDDADRDRTATHAREGATWWIEAAHPWRYGYSDGASWPTGQIASHRRRAIATGAVPCPNGSRYADEVCTPNL